jgi:hypothetical protein
VIGTAFRSTLFNQLKSTIASARRRVRVTVGISVATGTDCALGSADGEHVTVARRDRPLVTTPGYPPKMRTRPRGRRDIATVPPTAPERTERRRCHRVHRRPNGEPTCPAPADEPRPKRGQRPVRTRREVSAGRVLYRRKSGGERLVVRPVDGRTILGEFIRWGSHAMLPRPRRRRGGSVGEVSLGHPGTQARQPPAGSER